MSNIDYRAAMQQSIDNTTPLDEGTYDGLISHVSIDQSRRSGNDMVRVTIMDANPESNRRWISYTTLVRENRPDFDRIMNILSRFGASREELQAVDSQSALQELCVKYLANRDVTVALDTELDHNDVLVNKVKYFQPA